MTTKRDRHLAFEKVYEVIESCLTLDQLQVACNFVAAFTRMFGGRQDEVLFLAYVIEEKRDLLTKNELI